MQQFQLSIPEPCHQSWQQMTPTEQGRFCNACAKEVIDFSMMTDNEVLNYFNNLKHENVCGRTLPSQLERDILHQKSPEKKHFWYWHYITMFFLFFNKSANAKPQTGVILNKADVQEDPTTSGFLYALTGAQKSKNYRIISGKITDENGKGIPHVTVQVKGTRRIVKSDAYGVYVIKVDTNTEMLELSAAGYPAKIFNLANLKTYNFNLAATDNIRMFTGKMISRDIQKVNKVLPLLNISGKIIDGEGNSISYASVKVKDSPKGTSADSTGTFSLTVEYEDALLEFSALGYVPKTILAKDLSTLNQIVLEKSIDSLQELKVISYEGRIVMGAVSSYATVCTLKSFKNTFNDSLNLITTKITGALKVYPNPVPRGNTLNINLQIKQNGDYRIRIVDATGKIVLQKQVSVLSKQQTIQLPIDIKWSAGIYYISVLGSGNKLINTSKFSVL